MYERTPSCRLPVRLAPLHRNDVLGARMPGCRHDLDECVMVIVDETMLHAQPVVGHVDDDVARLQVCTQRIAETAEVHIAHVTNDSVESHMRVASEDDVRVGTGE